MTRRKKAASPATPTPNTVPALPPKPAPEPARTPTTLAPPGGRSSGGVSPSGFVLLPTYMPQEDYETRQQLPRFLNVVAAHPQPCIGCHGNCCTARVVLNVCDLVRLAAPLGMHPSSLCDLSECDSRNGEPILIGDTAKHMCLRKRDDDLCALLLDVDGQHKCGVHAIRPGICRMYPFSYARGLTIYQMGHVVCPKKWVLSDERRDRVLDDIEAHEQDRAVDRRIVKAWNQRPAETRTVAGFWMYAMEAAGEALGVDVGFLTDKGPRQTLLPRLW
jgi:Fe-S-cluster containining protein